MEMLIKLKWWSIQRLFMDEIKVCYKKNYGKEYIDEVFYVDPKVAGWKINDELLKKYFILVAVWRNENRIYDWHVM